MLEVLQCKQHTRYVMESNHQAQGEHGISSIGVFCDLKQFMVFSFNADCSFVAY